MVAQGQVLHLLGGDLFSDGVFFTVQAGGYLDAGSAPDQAKHFSQAGQWLACPMTADGAKKAMFNRVPFGGAGRIVAYSHLETQGIGQAVLQFDLPGTKATTVTSAGIGKHQQAPVSMVGPPPFVAPPMGKRGNGKAWRVSGDPDPHVSSAASDIIKTVGYCACSCILDKVMRVHVVSGLAPGPATVGKVTYQFFLFRVYAYDRVTGLREGRFLALKISELSIAIRMGRTGEAFETTTQSEATFFKRRRTVSRPTRYPFALNCSTKRAKLDRTHFLALQGSPAVSGSTNFAKSLSMPGCWTSMRLRPAPGRRTRPVRSIDSSEPISSRPRQSVCADSPLRRIIRFTAPRPRHRDSRATDWRRCRSLSVSKNCRYTRGLSKPGADARAEARWVFVLIPLHRHVSLWPLRETSINFSTAP